MEGLAEEIKTKRDAGRSARLKTSTTTKRPSEHAVAEWAMVTTVWSWLHILQHTF